jgi:hypothetical protein
VNYDIHNPTKTTRIFYDGIQGSQRMIKVMPGQTILNVALGETTVRMIQSRQHHLKLATTGDGGFQQQSVIAPPPAPPPRREIRTRPSTSRRAAPIPGNAPQLPVVRPSPNQVAVVIGGAEDVFDEWRQAKELCEEALVDPVTFVTNDSISLFPDRIDHAVTLHPDKYDREWRDARAARGLDPPGIVWAHRRHKVANRDTPDWGGSSGLFAIKVALEVGFDKIILCGVPMTLEAGHVVRKAPWRACDQFRRAWGRHQRELTNHICSFSGWTRTTFGPPSVGFLTNGQGPRIGTESQAGRAAATVD